MVLQADLIRAISFGNSDTVYRAFPSESLSLDYQICLNTFLKNPQNTPQTLKAQLMGGLTS